jgi:hypothetical protein
MKAVEVRQAKETDRSVGGMGGRKEGCMTLKNERKLEEIMKIYRNEMDKGSVVTHAGRLIRTWLASLQ